MVIPPLLLSMLQLYRFVRCLNEEGKTKVSLAWEGNQTGLQFYIRKTLWSGNHQTNITLSERTM